MKKLTAIIIATALLCMALLPLTATAPKTKEADIFDALEILKSLVGMENKAAQLTGITDRELTIYDVLDILKGIVGMGEPVIVNVVEEGTEPPVTTTAPPGTSTAPATTTTPLGTTTTPPGTTTPGTVTASMITTTPVATTTPPPITTTPPWTSTAPATTTTPRNIIRPPAIWEEVPVLPVEERPLAFGSRSPFDLRGVITGQSGQFRNHVFNTYSFKGTIISVKDYKISWIDNDGLTRGPDARGVIEVKLNKSYNGKSPVEGDIIRVYYPRSLSVSFHNYVNFIEGREYVFSGCWVIDDSFADYHSKYSQSLTNNEIEKHADVYMLGAWVNLFPVENGKVMLYHGYFAHNDEIMKKYIHGLNSDYKTDMLTSPFMLEYGDFIAMEFDEFEEEYLKLFENPERLPTYDWDSRFGR